MMNIKWDGEARITQQVDALTGDYMETTASTKGQTFKKRRAPTVPREVFESAPETNIEAHPRLPS